MARIKRNFKPLRATPPPETRDDTDMGEDLYQAAKPAPAKKGKKGKKGEKPAPALNPAFANRDVYDFDAPRPGEPKKKPKKLTAKAQQSLDDWSGAERGKKRDEYFLGLADSAKTKFGHRSVWAGTEMEALVVGIPLPGLAMEHLIQQDVLPLSIVIQNKGRQLTCKSAFLFEMYRWVARYTGMAVHMNTEDKFSPDLCSSTVGWGANECPVVFNKCESCEDWERKLTFWVNKQKHDLVGTAENPGPGRTIPVMFGVDSVMGKATEEKIEKINTEGASGRDYPTESLSIAGYMRARSGELDNWPFILVLVNHLKDDIGESGATRTPGGTFIGHQISFDFEMSIWKDKIETTDFDGRGVRIKCTKNALGVTGRSILTRMLWYDECIGYRPWDPAIQAYSRIIVPTKQVVEKREPLPVYRQKTEWDWDWATINLLLNLPPKYQERLKEVGFDSPLKAEKVKGDVDAAVCCRAVGMKKDEMKPFAEVGRMIREDPVLMDRLRTALSIKRRAVMKGDYLRQLDELAGELS